MVKVLGVLERFLATIRGGAFLFPEANQPVLFIHKLDSQKNKHPSKLQRVCVFVHTSDLISLFNSSLCDRSMIDAILDLVACGGTISICGTNCGRLTKTLQDDDADLWKDLTFQNIVPEPTAPPVPRVVQVQVVDTFDDVSTLNDTHYRRHEGSAKEDDIGDLELRIEVSGGNHGERIEHPVGYATKPETRCRRQLASPIDDPCDGSSYSSCHKKAPAANKDCLRQHTLSWQSDSTDATLQTQNHSYLATLRAR